SLNRAGPLLGGLLVGGAIAAMHYIGTAGIEIHADVIWSPTYVVASVLWGLGWTALAMFVAARNGGWHSQLAATFFFALAFAGMSAIAYRPDPLMQVHDAVVAPFMLATAIAAVAFSTVALGLMGSLLDHHLERQAVREAERLRRYVMELEATKQKLLIAKCQ